MLAFEIELPVVGLGIPFKCLNCQENYLPLGLLLDLNLVRNSQEAPAFWCWPRRNRTEKTILMTTDDGVETMVLITELKFHSLFWLGKLWWKVLGSLGPRVMQNRYHLQRSVFWELGKWYQPGMLFSSVWCSQRTFHRCPQHSLRALFWAVKILWVALLANYPQQRRSSSPSSSILTEMAWLSFIPWKQCVSSVS